MLTTFIFFGRWAGIGVVSVAPTAFWNPLNPSAGVVWGAVSPSQDTVWRPLNPTQS